MKTLPQWLKLISGNIDDADPGDIIMLLNQPIGGLEGVTSDAFGEVFNAIPKTKNMRLDINCLGGAIDDGIAIHNMIKAHGNVTTRVTGYAASMGAVIAQGGARREMMPGTMLVVHNPQVSTNGDGRDHERAMRLLDEVKVSLVDLLSNRSGQTKEKVSQMMSDVTAMSPQTAKSLGFCDTVLDGNPARNDMTPIELFDFLKDLKNSRLPMKPKTISKNAHAASESALASGKTEDHDTAAAAHEVAASAHKEDGDSDSAGLHKSLARFHRNVAGNKSYNPTNQINKTNMKNIIAAVAGLMTLPADSTEETSAPIIQNAIKGLLAERDALKIKVDSAAAALKVRVTNRVDKAIADKLIKAERKDSLIAIGLQDETALDFINDLSAPVIRQRGSAPVPAAKGSTDERIQALRNSMGDMTASEQAAAAVELRELRGHKSLFAVAE